MISYSTGKQEAIERFDARRTRKKTQFECTPGKSIPCKGVCIPKARVCRDEVNLTPTEKRQVTTIIERAKDKYEGRTIRDLQQEARERGVYRSNHLNKNQLTNVLKQLDKDPNAQENLRKTLEKRRKTREFATKAAPKELQKTWKAIQTVSKAYKQNPDQAGLIIAAGLMGVSAGIANRIRDRHREGLTESAEIALSRAKNVPIDRTNKPDLIFAVGGFGSTGSKGEKMRDLLEAPLDGTRGEQWFGKNHHIIPFNSPEFNITTNSSKRNADGKYNPAYLGEVSAKGFGKFLTNFRRSRNDAAVDLAARLYAYGQRYPNKRLDILAHGVGGNVTDEAVEILSKMKRTTRRGQSGSQLLERLNIARLGSPYFGMMNGKQWKKVNHRTITSNNDPFSILPKRAAKWIGSVTGGEVEDYLKNPDVRDQLKEVFGYYSSSLSGSRISEARRQESRKAIASALSTISPGAGVLWTQIGKIQDKARENPAAAAALSFAVVTGTSVAAYKQAKSKYNRGLNNASFAAENAVKDIKLSRTNRENITIAVGGTGTASQDIIDNLPQEIKDKTYTVNAQDYGVSTADVPNNLIPGTKAYAAYLAANGFGGQLNKIAKSQFGGEPIDPEAIQLAALLYKHGSRIYGRRRNRGFRDVNNYKLNILASGDGAIKAREAMEILEKMGGTRGKAIAKQVKLASFGSPDFGITNSDPGSPSRPKYVPSEVSYMGGKDFFGMFPSKRSAAVVRPSGVSHDIKDYLQNEEVKRNLIDNFYK